MVFELNLYELGHNSYDLFSKEMQKYTKSMSAPCDMTTRNGHIITCVFIQLNSKIKRFFMLKRMNLCNFVTRGARNGGITAPPTCCTRSWP